MTKLQTVLISLIALAFRVICGAQPTGGVIYWGDNFGGSGKAGSLGYSTEAVAFPAEALSNVIAVAAGTSHNLALKRDGTVFGWGWNNEGQVTGVKPLNSHNTNGLVLIRNEILKDVVSIAAGGDFSLALIRDGTLVIWGKNQLPPGLSNVTAIAASGSFSVVLKSDGTVMSWSNQPQVASHVPKGLSNVMAIACGGKTYERGMALKKDGSVVVWKASLPNEETVPKEVTNIVAIAVGECHSLALRRDGNVYGWGCNGSGQATGVVLSRPPQESSFANGLVAVNGQLLSNITSIAAGGEYDLALKKDGTVVAWGNKRFYRDVPAGLTNIVAVAAGDGYCLAIVRNGL